MSFALSRVMYSSLIGWVVLLGVGVYFLMPLREKLRFGIDLVGGSYITLEVQTGKAVEVAVRTRVEVLLAKLEEANKTAPLSYEIKGAKADIIFPSLDAVQAASLVMRDASLVQTTSGTTLSLVLDEALVKKIQTDAVDRNIEVLRTRLDKLSVAEITITRHGESRIVVELPDVSDPQQAKAMIGTAAVLEFKLVERIGANPEDILYEYDGVVPSGMEILSGRGDSGHKMYYLVSKTAAVTGSDLRDATAVVNQDKMQWIVSFVLTDEGGRKFYEVTSNNYRRNLAIILDDVVISAPEINQAIRSEGQIYGSFTKETAKELAVLLRSGSYVAPVTFEEERQVGPSLGAESIRQGMLSCLVGLALVFIFALYYYRLPGLLAFVALLYNLVLILLGMSWLSATLTLPGIAGMVLTVGMAIDASILIFERIKEELAAGIPVRKAVADGFSEAMRVILDSNITTFVVGLVLYRFGAGPVLGFAVTMMLGIVATLITGLFFLRSLFMFVIDVFNIQKLRI